jgi:hypothetical protein
LLGTESGRRVAPERGAKRRNKSAYPIVKKKKGELYAEKRASDKNGQDLQHSDLVTAVVFMISCVSANREGEGKEDSFSMLAVAKLG